MSKVILFRNLDGKVSKADLEKHCSLHGPIAAISFFAATAFVEMTTEDDAKKVLEASKELKINDTQITVKASTKKTLTIPPSKVVFISCNTKSGKKPTPADTEKFNKELVEKLCQPYGPVDKIVVFRNSKGIQALAQFQTVEAATAARSNLDGKQLPEISDEIVLSVDFSRGQVIKDRPEKTKPATEEKPATETKPAPKAATKSAKKPAAEKKPVAEAKPATETKPGGEAKPAPKAKAKSKKSKAKAKQASKEAVQPAKPAEEKPAAETKPAGEVKPAETKPATETKAATQRKRKAPAAAKNKKNNNKKRRVSKP